MKSYFYIFVFVSCTASGTARTCSYGLKEGEVEGRSGDSDEKQFRCDYQYVESIDGWLKYHEIPANWFEARLRCYLEGTTLASPLNYPLQAAIQKATEKFGVGSKAIFTGIHATFSSGDYFSVEGVPLSQIVHTWASGQPSVYDDDENCLVMKPDGRLDIGHCKHAMPYVCYKTHTELDQVNDECGTTDKEYAFSNVTGSCYKFHTVPRTWSRAHMACAAEGGYLAIINSDSEAEVLKKIFESHPPDSMLGRFWKDVAYIGFHDWGEHGEFLTVNGETLKQAGYDKFSPGEPNNSTTGEYCGSIYRNGMLNDLWCDYHYAFICEKNPASLLCESIVELKSGEEKKE